MKNETSPGSDGFNVEFYKFFWKDLCGFLFKSLNTGYNMQHFSEYSLRESLPAFQKKIKTGNLLKQLEANKTTQCRLQDCLNRSGGLVQYLEHRKREVKGSIFSRVIPKTYKNGTNSCLA